MAALWSGDLDGLRQLLSSGADLNSPGRKVPMSRLPSQVPSYPLIWAVHAGKPEAVRLLLDSGADPNICCNYIHDSRAFWCLPLCLATHLGIATMLLDAGADVNAQQRSLAGTQTTLLRAAAISQPSIGELLIERDADVNTADESGSMALYHAIFHRHDEMAARLVQVR